MQTNRFHTNRMVALAILAAIIVILQLFGSMIHIGPVSFSLVLVPIVIGSVLFGSGAGLFLGAVFGVITLVGCVSGADPGGFILWTANPLLTALVCLSKAMLAGFLSGFVYRYASGKTEFFGVLLAALTAPIVNTFVFCLAMFFPFRSVLTEWAGGTDLVQYVLLSIVGLNFLVELSLNALLCPGIYRIVAVRKRS